MPTRPPFAAPLMAVMLASASCDVTETTKDPTTDTASTSSPSTATTLTVDSGTVPADFYSYVWTELAAESPWSARAGLHVVELGSRFYLMGGRTPIQSPIPLASDIWSDVWVSDDLGATWTEILPHNTPGTWPARAYFQAVTLGDKMYVLGGQNVGFPSDFFSDVWSSSDGVTWTEETSNAGWEGRAGLRAVTYRDEMYIFGGSTNDDSAIIGPSGPKRLYFNDVWKSSDGASWEQVTSNAPWEPRAGAVVVVKDDAMYMLGGEAGFLCQPQPDCDPPYFNDVWRSEDGETWELIVAEAPWSSRPGHQCAVLEEHFVCFGGFGMIENPLDVWVSPDGAAWEQVSAAPWNATSEDEVKYDFEAFAFDGAIYTFGGDRETFDFGDPENYLRVDSDVWRFHAPDL